MDFGEATIFLNGQTVKAALFVMSLPYSDAVFIRAYWSSYPNWPIACVSLAG